MSEEVDPITIRSARRSRLTIPAILPAHAHARHADAVSVCVRDGAGRATWPPSSAVAVGIQEISCALRGITMLELQVELLLCRMEVARCEGKTL